MKKGEDFEGMSTEEIGNLSIVTVIVGILFVFSCLNINVVGKIGVNEISLDHNSSNLIAYWDFNEGSGNILRDKSGNGHNGTIHGNPHWVDGVIGKALEFDGINDYISVEGINLTDSNDFSIIFWAKKYSSKDGTVLGNWDFFDNGWQIAYYNGKYILEGPNNVFYETTSYINLSKYYCIAIVNHNKFLDFYVNGKLDSSYLLTHNFSNVKSFSTIGTLNYFHNWYYDGIIDELRIYNVSLSAYQIYEYYTTCYNSLVSDSDLEISKSDILLSSPRGIGKDGDIAAGDKVNISVKVHNCGNISESNIVVKIFVDNEQIGGDLRIDNLAKNSVDMVETTWRFSAGTHTIKVLVDPDDNIPEIHEDNNEALKTVNVKESSDLLPGFSLIEILLAGIIVVFISTSRYKK